MNGGRYRGETLFERKHRWFSNDVVSLRRVARAGDVLTHSFSYNDEKTFVVDGEVVELRIGSEWKSYKLTREELGDLATEFFRLRADPTYTEILLTVKGGTFKERSIAIPEKLFRDVEECLGEYRRAPLEVAGAYR